jgi:hypothetical protein
MQAADVQCQVERVCKERQVGHVPSLELAVHPGPAGLSPRPANGQDGEIHPHHLPAVAGQVDAIGAGAAAQVQRPARGKALSLDQLYHLGRGHLRVPGWPAQQVVQVEGPVPIAQ